MRKRKSRKRSRRKSIKRSRRKSQKRSMRKSIKRSMRKSIKRSREISLITDAGSTPIIINTVGDSFKISGLISCVGVVIKVLEPEPSFKIKAIIGGHFVTPKMYDDKKKKLTKEGKKFITDIKSLCKKYKNKNSFETTLYIGKSARKRANILSQKNAHNASIAIKAALGMQNVVTHIGESTHKFSL